MDPEYFAELAKQYWQKTFFHELRWALLLQGWAKEAKVENFIFETQHVINPEGWRTLTQAEIEALQNG